MSDPLSPDCWLAAVMQATNLDTIACIAQNMI